jgi:hypothetical protein
MPTNNDATLDALQEIKSIMDKSERVVSLKGMGGVWVGLTAIVASAIGHIWLQKPEFQVIGKPNEGTPEHFDQFTIKLLLLGIITFVVACSGALYFTKRKAKKSSTHLWNNASRQMLLHLFFPLLAGGIFCVVFIYYGCGMFVVPSCLVFYGLGLIGASRHTFSDIRYLGMLDVVLGCTSLFYPGFGLYFWAVGFGLLHVLYGAAMWGKPEESSSTR